MKSVMRIVGSVFMTIVLCLMMTTMALAAEEDTVWLNVSVSSGETEAQIMTNTTVTDGLVKVTYDSQKLTYQGILVEDAYVSMYAVNAEEPGVVLVSWVAPEEYDASEEGAWMLQLLFSGEAAEDSVALTGKAQNGAGTEVPISESTNYVDRNALEAAVAEAEELKESDYTEGSFAAVEEALTEAKAVLEDLNATQEEVDAAEKALTDAMNALVNIVDLQHAVDVAKGKVAEDYTEKSYNKLQKARAAAEEVLNDPDATQKEVDKALDNLKKAINGLRSAETGAPVGADNADTGDTANVIMPAVLAAAALVVMAGAGVMKKRGLAK